MRTLTRRLALPTLNDPIRIVSSAAVWRRVVLRQDTGALGDAAVSASAAELMTAPSGPGSFPFLVNKVSFVLPPTQALYAARIGPGPTSITVQVSESAPEEV